MTSDFPSVNSYRLSHEAILATVAELQALTRNYLQAKSFLFDLRERTAAYLGRQDQEFYEKLEIFFAEDRPALKIIEFLKHDLKDFKVQWLIFFEKHSGEAGVAYRRNFAKDFREFANVILLRVKMEEDYLFPLMARMGK